MSCRKTKKRAGIAVSVCLLILAFVLSFVSVFPASGRHLNASAETVNFSQAELNRLIYATDATQKNNVSELTEKLDDEKFTLDATFNGLSKVGMAASVIGALKGMAEKVNPVLGVVVNLTSKILATGTIVQTNINIKKMLEQSVVHLDEKLGEIADCLEARMDEQDALLKSFALALDTYFKEQNYSQALQTFAYDTGNSGVFGDNTQGYFGWQKELLKAYQRVLEYNGNDNVPQDTLKRVYDNLYAVASYSSVLYGYMTSNRSFGGNSIQDILYEYYLLSAASLGASFGNTLFECLEFVQDLYSTYYIAQVCMKLCMGYQISYLTEQYGTDYETLKLHHYELASSIVSQNRDIFYTDIENGVRTATSGIDDMSAELAAFYARVLNLDESYRYTPNGGIGVFEVGYEELFDSAGYRTSSVAVQGIGSSVATSYHYRKNDRVHKGDTLYLSVIPERLEGVFDLGFTFTTSDPAVARVNDDGTVHVVGNAGQSFTISLCYAKKTVYYMTFRIEESVLGGGLGTVNAPFLINSAEQYTNFVTNTDLHQAHCYTALNADISNTSASIPDFAGVFDGRGFTITGATAPVIENNRGTIRNLTVTGANLYRQYSTWDRRNSIVLSAIACQNRESGVIENCTVSHSEIRAIMWNAFIDGTNYYLTTYAVVGAIAGKNYGTVRGCTSVSNGVFAEAHANDTVDQGLSFKCDPYGYAGGLIGSNESGNLIADNYSGDNRVAVALTNAGYSYKMLWSHSEVQTTAHFYVGGLMGNSGSAQIVRNVVNGNNYWTDWRPVARGNNANTAIKQAYKSEHTGVLIGEHSGAKPVDCSGNVSDSYTCTFNALSEAQKTSYSQNGWDMTGSVPVRAARATRGLNVLTMPLKLTYDKGEEFNPSGLLLVDDGGRVIKDYTLSGFDSSTYGVKKINATSGGLGVEFTVTVRCSHRNVDLVERTDKLTEGYRCRDCGEWALAPAEYEAHEHEWVITPMTPAQHKKTCSICGEEMAEDHAIDEYTVSDDSHTGTCSICMAEVNQHHVYTERILEPATCTTAGSKRLTCSFCGKSVVEAVEALGHTPAAAVRENVVQATCTETGSYDSVVYCADCGVELSREKGTIPANGHTPASVIMENIVNADCVNGGSYDEVTYCGICNAELSRTKKAIEPTGHTAASAVKENETAPTCTEKGSYDEVVSCAVCNKELSRTQKETEPTGHKESAWILDIPATEFSAGSRHKECTVCHALLAEEDIPVAGSDKEDPPQVSVEAGCAEEVASHGILLVTVGSAVVLPFLLIAIKRKRKEGKR